MRQRLGKPGLRKWRRRTGLDVVSGMVRGGTHHRVDLWLADGRVARAFNDGTLLVWRDANTDEPESEGRWRPLTVPRAPGPTKAMDVLPEPLHPLYGFLRSRGRSDVFTDAEVERMRKML